MATNEDFFMATDSGHPTARPRPGVQHQSFVRCVRRLSVGASAKGPSVTTFLSFRVAISGADVTTPTRPSESDGGHTRVTSESDGCQSSLRRSRGRGERRHHRRSPPRFGLTSNSSLVGQNKCVRRVRAARRGTFGRRSQMFDGGVVIASAYVEVLPDLQHPL